MSDLNQNTFSSVESKSPVELSPVKRALLEIRELRQKLAHAEQAAEHATQQRNHPIAIVGMGVRFPGGVTDVASFWQLLEEGKDAITEIPRDRWDWRQYFDPNPETSGSMNGCRGGFLEDIDRFDADFFGIAPREARMMDPQQRLLLEVAWHALENASIPADQLENSATGLFLGLSNVDYLRPVLQDDLRIDAYAGSGNSASMAAGRLAYALGLHGPAITIDTSCSSSLVAIHLAMQSLRSGESNLALAGGVSLILGPQMNIGFSRAHMLSPDGKCKTFDASADGYVRSEGCAIVVLKRLRDAIQDNDHIIATIRGSAINHDGRSGGLTAPSSLAQTALLREAHRNAEVTVDQVSLVEAHGTGTSLGDPIEVEALGEVFRSRSQKLPPVAIGSLKTNLGHMEAAAGVAGLLKVALSLEHRRIPAHLHFHQPSALIDWDSLPLHVSSTTRDWVVNPDQPARIAGVSSFGFSGSNAHLILEEYLSPTESKHDPTATTEPVAIAVLSGRTAAALQAAQADLSRALNISNQYSLRDLCQTLVQGRAHHTHRQAWVVRSLAELKSALATESVNRFSGASPAVTQLFTGQGSEQSGMGLDLLQHSVVFRDSISRLDDAVAGILDKPIAEIWTNASGELSQARYVQPALYAYGWALSELWRSWGVAPRIVLGHSLGEYIAATVAGVLTAEEGIRLVAMRGRLTEQLGKPGGMIALVASETKARELLSTIPGLSIAAINGPTSVVISGDLSAIEAFEATLKDGSIRHKRLRTTHGFHSAALDPMLDAFEAEAGKISYRLPEVTWISNLTGKAVERNQPITAQYWRNHLRQSVQFEASLTAAGSPGSLLLEIGPEPQLSALAEANGIQPERLIASIGKSNTSEWHKLLTAAARLYTCGLDLNWKAVNENKPYTKIQLPLYPFQRQRYWFNQAIPAPENESQLMNAAAIDQSGIVPIALEVALIQEQQGAANQWATSLMLSTLQQLGCWADSGASVSPLSLIAENHIAATHQRLMLKWLHRLAAAGIVDRSGTDPMSFALRAEADFPDTPSLWEKAKPFLKSDSSLKHYLENCSRLLVRVLRGEVSPLETLFPGGSNELAKNLYEQSPASAYVNRIAAAAIAARARVGAKTAMGFQRRLRILEIGAGTGSTTASVLAVLSPDAIRYTFSDVSEIFLKRAQQRFHSHPIEFTLFDLDQDEHSSAHQGRYDVVLIANALHAATDLDASLTRVQQVLQPGGCLVLVETTLAQAWHDVSTGLIEGWQHFADDRREDSPLLSVDQWRDRCTSTGFVNFASAPAPSLPTDALGLHVLIAQKPQDSSTTGVDDQVDRHFGETPIAALASSLSDLTGQALDLWLHSDSPVSGLLAKEIAAAPAGQRLNLVLEHTTAAVAHTLGRADTPQPDARLMDLGLDSLMAIELRNRLQQVFLIDDLPSTLIFDYPTSALIARMLLLTMGYASDGQRAEPDTLDNLVDELNPPDHPVGPVQSIHTDDELDAMSDNEIADLLRIRLEQ